MPISTSVCWFLSPSLYLLLLPCCLKPLSNHEVIIIGYGGIGKLLAKCARNLDLNLFIYTGRADGGLSKLKGGEKHYSGPLEKFIKLLLHENLRNKIIFWCCGPDTVGTNTTTQFFHQTILVFGKYFF